MKSEIEILCEQLHAAVEALPDDIMPMDVRIFRARLRIQASLNDAFEQMTLALQPAIAAIHEFGKAFRGYK